MDILKYKDYEGTAELDMSHRVCRGKLLFIQDLVTYQAASPEKLQKAFESAVDDYIKTCKALGRPAQKPLRGQFNVRVSPATHKAAVIRAISEDTSLNEVVSRALEAYLTSKPAGRVRLSGTAYPKVSRPRPVSLAR